MIQQKFRKDYPGEFIVLQVRYVDGKKQEIREWVENPIQNDHMKRAAVIGTNLDRHFFDYSKLERHRGGLLASKKLQTYVTGQMWREIKADFLVETDRSLLEEFIKEKYTSTRVCYTTATNCIRYPGEFYLVPFNPKIDVMALPLYLAAFDGHEEIFVMGYTKITESGTKAWRTNVDQVIRAYPGVKFYFVGPETNTPEMWRHNKNVSCMTYRDFITYCDV